MHILALDTYHGGSHQAFIDRWQAHSEHQWTLLTLPARHWKWRMRHAAIYFAEQLQQFSADAFDIVLCTDMLNLAEFIGLTNPLVQTLPRVVYFHENQLDYPDQNATEKDLHYAFSNFTSALAASQVWFNSHWHKQTFQASLKQWLGRMPDYQPLHAIEKIIEKSIVQSPGISDHLLSNHKHANSSSPLVILWAARWEQDKNPQTFFHALRQLKQQGIDFRLNILGAGNAHAAELFNSARSEFSGHIDQWGYVENEQDYISVLTNSDIIVSTAMHEFFGIAVLEAVACGCIPLVPKRLAYPETLSLFIQHHPECFYDGSVDNLAKSLMNFATTKSRHGFSQAYRALSLATAQKYHWTHRAKEMDKCLHNLTR